MNVGQTDIRQTDRQTDRQADRQTDKQTVILQPRSGLRSCAKKLKRKQAHVVGENALATWFAGSDCLTAVTQLRLTRNERARATDKCRRRSRKRTRHGSHATCLSVGANCCVRCARASSQVFRCADVLKRRWVSGTTSATRARGLATAVLVLQGRREDTPLSTPSHTAGT